MEQAQAQGAAEVIRIVFTTEDVVAIADELGVDRDTALARADEWGRHIADTASGLCSEQLTSCIKNDTP